MLIRTERRFCSLTASVIGIISVYIDSANKVHKVIEIVRTLHDTWEVASAADLPEDDNGLRLVTSCMNAAFEEMDKIDNENILSKIRETNSTTRH